MGFFRALCDNLIAPFHSTTKRYSATLRCSVLMFYYIIYCRCLLTFVVKNTLLLCKPCAYLCIVHIIPFVLIKTCSRSCWRIDSAADYSAFILYEKLVTYTKLYLYSKGAVIAYFFFLILAIAWLLPILILGNIKSDEKIRHSHVSVKVRLEPTVTVFGSSLGLRLKTSGSASQGHVWQIKKKCYIC